MWKKDKGFTLFETLIASLLLFSMLTILLPLLSIIAKEQYNSIEKVQITSKLHDDMQGVLAGAAPFQDYYTVTPYQTPAAFSFSLEGEYLKGCAEWTNAKQKKRVNASTRLWSNTKGFTFISMLVAMTVLVLTLPFVSYALSALQLKQTNTEALSVQQFFTQLHYDVMSSSSAHVANNQLYIRAADRNDHTESIARVSLYNNTVRRQVNGLGHEIYLRQVADITFEEHANAIYLTITKESGDVYEKTIYNYP